MKILCSDLEGTLAPEIWQEIGKEFKVPELDLTTRDIPDFDKLMFARMSALQNKKISYETLLEFLNSIDPIDGAKDFLDSLSNHYQIIIVSDTFYEFVVDSPEEEENLKEELKEEILSIIQNYDKEI